MTSFKWTDGVQSKIEILGKSLETICYGPPPEAAPTIIMLHEGLGCIDLWRDFPRAISANTGFGVIAYSRAGHGSSDPCELPRSLDYMSHEALSVLPAVINHIGISKCILLGHSDGATISAIYAGSVEDFRVRGLVLIAPHFFTEKSGLAAIEDTKKAFSGGKLKDKLSKYHSDADATFHGWSDVWLNPDFQNWNVSEVIDYLRVPVLAIQGRNDEFGTAAQIEEIENRIYAPLDVEWLDDCGHSPHSEQAETSKDAVVEFAHRLHRIETEDVNTAHLESAE